MEARANESGSVAQAKSLLAEAQSDISRISHPREDLPVWLLSTRGSIAVIENDGASANRDFSAALRKAEATPSFDETARMRINGLLAFSYIRLGDGAKAEPLFRQIAEFF